MSVRLQIEPTDHIVDIEAPRGALAARAWQGVTEEGVNVVLFIATVVVPTDAPPEVQERFERTLREAQAPSLSPSFIMRLAL